MIKLAVLLIKHGDNLFFFSFPLEVTIDAYWIRFRTEFKLELIFF